MTLVISGFQYRTSGHYEPFGHFEERWPILNSDIGVIKTLPLQDNFIKICAIEPNFIRFLHFFGEKERKLEVQLESPIELTDSRNVLGVQIRFSLEEGDK